MNYKLIMLPNPIVVSDEEIKEGDTVYTPNGVVIAGSKEGQIGWLDKKGGNFLYFGTEGSKIIAGIEGLPTVNISLVADEIGWVDVEKLAQKNSELEYPFEDYRGKTKGVDDDGTGQALRGANLVGFENGFKAAQSLNEKRCKCFKKEFNVTVKFENNICNVISLI